MFYHQLLDKMPKGIQGMINLNSNTNAIPGVDGRLISHITCYNCNCKGHYADNCPGQSYNETNDQQHMQTRDTINNNTSDEEMNTNEQMLQLEGQDGEEDIAHFTWKQIKVDNKLKYKDTHILIDIGSTFSVFKNPQMLLNIKENERKMKAYTNGGRQDSTLVGDLSGFFKVWYNPRSMINILTWSDVANKYMMTSDTAKRMFITVHLSEERRMNLVEVESGLYLFRNRVHAITNNKMSGYSYLMLTEANMSEFTNGEIQRAQRTRDLHRGMAFTGYKKLLWLLKNNKVVKSEVTWDDTKRALQIYGNEAAIIKGKIAQKTQGKIQCKNRIVYQEIYCETITRSTSW